ncbi:DUF6059 family protein [Streptomyces lancefieldiae]|uniref:DUF6059 family protein n=1 Tax=Streptomyces lancefieldiae TaxID=3075520 RepID=A0ABU3AV88_9ACTN|nr:DUF6059 family protein [Streptomyces sp. DSM 40712]MDT0612736.1 DUF6059 family protein [Streptomyces sp. DSM 40712]
MGRWCPRRFVRGLWEGLVAYGRLCVVGETAPYEEEVRPKALWRHPPPGHPERLRPDLPLTDLERRLARELTDDAQNDRKAA